jgi:ADP-heptose:LPS heptosyltransferase
MKITIGSPDGLGDFILRLPLIEGLREAGHELQILLRPPAFDLAQVALPGCRVVKIEKDPYAPAVQAQGFPFRSEHREIETFAPDLYLAAPFNISFFDQVWVERHSGDARMAGFACASGTRFCPTTCDPERIAARFSITAAVDPFLPEGEKNHTLLETLLGKSVAKKSPVLAAREADLAEARKILAAHGIAEGAYWVACVGHRPGIASKDWGEKNWSGFFQENFANRSVLFLGNAREAESIARIAQSLPASARFANLASAPPPLPVSLALAQLSAGYVGRDSGVMHLAAAVGKPVFAVFSGAFGARFWPQADRGAVVVQDWPCRECESFCAHDAGHCVHALPPEAVSAAWTDFENRSGPGLTVRKVPLPEGVARALAEEASRRYARQAQAFATWKAGAQRTVNWMDALGKYLSRMARRKFL